MAVSIVARFFTFSIELFSNELITVNRDTVKVLSYKFIESDSLNWSMPRGWRKHDSV